MTLEEFLKKTERFLIVFKATLEKMEEEDAKKELSKEAPVEEKTSE
jgi:hypothetical protein